MSSRTARSLCISLLLIGTMARAEEDAGVQAKQQFQRGRAEYQLENYDVAIEHWEAGYRLKEAPEFLYNIAQAYRLSKRPEKALSFYRKYLRLSPNAANRAEVERHIVDLNQVVEQHQRASTAPPVGAISSDSRPPIETNRAPTVAPLPLSSSPPPPAPTSVATEFPSSEPASADRPVYQRRWFWPTVAGGVVVIAAIVVVAVLVSGGDSQKTLPTLSF